MDATQQIREEGYTLIRQAVSREEVHKLKEEMKRVFSEPMLPGDEVYQEFWRMLIFERSALFQKYLELPIVLKTIEPILGKNCHVIANAGWMTPQGYGGGPWHTDAGPQVPRSTGIPWDDRIPYPIFTIGCMLYLTDVPLEAGPTCVVPGSHKSGLPVPKNEDNPCYLGGEPLPLPCDAGDIALFSSDTWHRGLPHTAGEPRIVYQVHYGRRDIAQRFRPFKNQRLPDEVVERASPRGRSLLGVHPVSFYG
jgi:ectoine hydroxylase-related dioxygenase (phytanoyl-CoA dioxygenase family)